MRASSGSSRADATRRLEQWLLRAALGSRRPRVTGRLRVECRQALEIRRDDHGVCYVDATNEHDAWFGLGFCHGQDRSGQLEILVRLLRGTLSAAVGEAGLGVDRLSRSVGFRRAARAQWPTLDEDLREQVTGYVRGVNAARRITPRSHEVAVLRCEHTSWEPLDVLALGTLMCFSLPANWDVEIARLHVLMNDGPEALATLDPTYPADLAVTFPPGADAGPAMQYLTADLRVFSALVGEGGGSNAWALRSSRTATGRPLLANDPHLQPSIPNTAYLAHVRCPSFAVVGASVVGAPAFMTGHNGCAAWGTTAAHIDNTDLFLEQLSSDGRAVREGERFVPIRVEREVIHVKGRTHPVEHQVPITARGPIVAAAADPSASIFEPTPLPRGANAISLSATWLAARPTRAILRCHEVRSFAQFREVFSKSTSCTYSMMYADVNDDIGWVLGTEVPERRSGNGSLPLPGWQRTAGWTSRVFTSEELPFASNPTEGFLCCANNKPVPDTDSTVFLGHDFLDGYRQKRIATQLRARSDWNRDATAALQLDVTTGAWREIRTVVEEATPSNDDEALALETLRGWDGRMSTTSAAASVYGAFLSHLSRRIGAHVAPKGHEVALGRGLLVLSPSNTFNTRRTSHLSRMLTTQPPGVVPSWQAEITGALGDAVRTLRERCGSDPSGWQWGRVRPIRLQHPFDPKPRLAEVFKGPSLPGFGDSSTVNQSSFSFNDPLRSPTFTAHVRSIIDVGNWSDSRFVLLGGQSGNPLSPHHRDLVELWQSGRGVPIWWEPAKVRQHARRRLQLRPSARIPPSTEPGERLVESR